MCSGTTVRAGPWDVVFGMLEREIASFQKAISNSTTPCKKGQRIGWLNVECGTRGRLTRAYTS